MSVPNAAEELILKVYEDEWHNVVHGGDPTARVVVAIEASRRTATRTGVSPRRVREVASRWGHRLQLVPRGRRTLRLHPGHPLIRRRSVR